MPPQSRVSDLGKVDADAHGCPVCPHKCIGPCIVGSPDVYVNKLPAARQDDVGLHLLCCGPNMWTATEGSGTVFINDKAAHREGDAQKHCGGSGEMDTGSDDVITGG